MDQKLQQVLLKVHQMLQPKQAGKGPKIQDYVEEIFEASLNFDLEYLNEENTDNLLQALLKPDLSNRIKLFLYTKLGNKFSELDKKVSLKKIEQKIQRNGSHILKIASRA
ncbi:5933_t:CDS:2, partial [Cetraspora pellucida]